MKLGRLLTADILDVADRSRQELQRSIDRLLMAAVPPGSAALNWFEHLTWRPAVSDQTAQGTRIKSMPAAQVTPGRFFVGLEDPHVARYFEHVLPDSREAVLDAADGICQRRFHLLGHRALYLGDRIDWHRDAVSGKRAPFVHWSRLNPLDWETVGDSKVTWELNRHQWLLALGQAYRFTGDERYASVFEQLISDWIRDNPPGMGINWASSLEVAYRLISWLWALQLFRASPILTPRFRAQLTGLLSTHAAHIETYLSHYFSPNTHLTGEALGLFYAGLLLSNQPGAKRWRRLGMRVLLRQLHLQVLPDGVYFEQSTHYQKYVADIYLHFLILASRNRIRIPENAGRRVRMLLDNLLTMRRPDGTLPQIGDSDGGNLLPLSARSPEDVRGIFGVAAVFFQSNEYAWAAGEAGTEIAWLLGTAGLKIFEGLRKVPPRRQASRLFPAGGYAVMRDSWGRHANQLLFDVGPLGCPISGGHGHADLLSIQCSALGRTQLVDPGTFTYTAQANWRKHFRNTSAHNTIVVDRRSQALDTGPFAWRDRPRARLTRWQSNAGWDFADAVHGAYRNLPDPVTHRRRILFVKPRYWLVVDELYGEDVHEVELLFQFAGRDLSLLNEGNWAQSSASDGVGLYVIPIATTRLDAEINIGEVEPIRGWLSQDYGLRSPAALLRYSTVVRLPLRIVTLLVPKVSNTDRPPDVDAEVKLHETTVRVPSWAEHVTVDDEVIRVERRNGAYQEEIVAF